MEHCVVEIVRTYGELPNHRMRRHLRKLNRFKGLLLRQVDLASSPFEADFVGQSASSSSVHEDSPQPLRRSTRHRRPPERLKDFIMS